MTTCPHKTAGAAGPAADAAPPHASSTASSKNGAGTNAAPGGCPMGFGAASSAAKGGSNGAASGATVASAAACPHIQGPSTPSATDAPSSAAAVSPGATCPYGFGSKGSGNTQAAGDEAAPAAAATAAGPASPGVCPFGFGSAPSSAADEPAAATGAPEATCPYGFGSGSSGPKLSILHCTLCKSLLYDAQAVHGCKHIFCGACLGRFKDCPLCGRDIVGTSPATEAQGLVDQFLEAHSKNPELMVGKVDIGPTLDNSLSSFYLAIGLRSLAGGNVPAALQRLQQCKQQLVLQAGAPASGASTAEAAASAPAAEAPAGTATGEAAAEPASAARHTQDGTADGPGTSTSAEAQAAAGVAATGSAGSSTASDAEAVRLAARIGAVCGTIGDCWRRLGDAAAATAAYEESCSALRRVTRPDTEVSHALSVSLNKLGDLAYMAGDVAAAYGRYCEALQLRRAAVAGMKLGAFVAGGVGPVLELSTSFAKVADAARELGNAKEAAARFGEARALLHRLEATEAAGALEGPLAAKLQSVWQVVGTQEQ